MKIAYTSGEAAKLCGLGLSTLKRWIDKGALKAYRTPGGNIRIRRDHLNDFLREYNIPVALQRSETLKLVMAVDDKTISTELINECKRFKKDIDIKNAENDMELGYVMNSQKPDVIILQSTGELADVKKMQEIRDLCAPHPVRIGLISENEISFPALCSPEALIIAGSTSWQSKFINRLLGSVNLLSA